MKFPITKNENPGTMPEASKLGFGSVFSDHMFVMDYNAKDGWHDARIVPYGPISLSPAASVFHYAGEVFEGLKAYRRKDSKVQLFRHDATVERLNISAERIGLPQVPADVAMAAIEQLVELDQAWVPSAPGTSLYIRPFLFATDPALALHGVHEAMFVIILSPSGSYYAEGLNPVKIMLETEDVRAVRGGTGYTKCGGNYAASIRAGERAEKAGYTQVLWLDGVHRKYIEEVGSMNVLFKIDGKIVTPELTGSVLPGITRRSCLELLREWGDEVEERLSSAEELFGAAEEGRLEEAFGSGTAAVISPIGELAEGDEKCIINNNQIGEVTQKLYDQLTGIQWGRVADPHNWITKVV